MKMAVIDLETTGFDPRDCIVEVGACELNLESDQTVKLLDMVVKEDHFTKALHGHSWIFAHSTLKVWDVLNATSWKNAEREIRWILEDYAVTAFNKAFDFSFLRHRELLPKRTLPCPMICAAETLRIPVSQRFRESWVGTLGKYKWPTLEEAWRHYFPGLDYIEQHRAFDDALHEALLIKAMHIAEDYRIEEEPT